jgi:hypothetical protein
VIPDGHGGVTGEWYGLAPHVARAVFNGCVGRIVCALSTGLAAERGEVADEAAAELTPALSCIGSLDEYCLWVERSRRDLHEAVHGREASRPEVMFAQMVSTHEGALSGRTRGLQVCTKI